MTLAQIEKRAVRRALLRAQGSVSRAAKELAVSRQTLYNLARRYDWLDEQGQIDPNLVSDGRRGRDYWKPTGFRDTASNGERKRKQRAHYHSSGTNGRDMHAVRLGDSYLERETIVS